jgi:hypothetical protein
MAMQSTIWLVMPERLPGAALAGGGGAAAAVEGPPAPVYYR